MQACDFHCKPPTSSDLNEPDCCLCAPPSNNTKRYACVPQGSFIIAIIIAIHGSHACACICTDVHTHTLGRGFFLRIHQAARGNLKWEKHAHVIYFLQSLSWLKYQTRERGILFSFAGRKLPPRPIHLCGCVSLPPSTCARRTHERTLKFAHQPCDGEKMPSNIFIVQEFLS